MKTETPICPLFLWLCSRLSSLQYSGGFQDAWSNIQNDWMLLRNVQIRNTSVFTWENLKAQKCKSPYLVLEVRIVDYVNEISFDYWLFSSLLTVQV